MLMLLYFAEEQKYVVALFYPLFELNRLAHFIFLLGLFWKFGCFSRSSQFLENAFFPPEFVSHVSSEVLNEWTGLDRKKKLTHSSEKYVMSVFLFTEYMAYGVAFKI